MQITAKLGCELAIEMQFSMYRQQIVTLFTIAHDSCKILNLLFYYGL